MVFYFKLDEAEATRRLMSRHRSDDLPAAIDHRLAWERAELEPLVEHYRERGLVSEIDASGTVDEVFVRMSACLL